MVKVLNIYVGDNKASPAVKASGFRQNRAVFRNYSVAAEDGIRGGFPDASGGIYIGCQTAGGLLPDQFSPVGGFSNQLIAGGGVKDNSGACGALAAAGGGGGPEVFADLNPEGYFLSCFRGGMGKQYVRAKGHGESGVVCLFILQASAAGEPAGFIKLPVIGNNGFRYGSVHFAAAYDQGAVEQAAADADRGANNKNTFNRFCCVRKEHGHGLFPRCGAESPAGTRSAQV